MKNSFLLMKVLPILGGIHVLLHLILAVFLLICIFALRINIQNRYKKSYPEIEIQPSITIKGLQKTVLIRYDETNVDNVDNWVNVIDTFFKAYRNKIDERKVASLCDCKHWPKRGQNCPIDLDNFGPCIPPFYGYYSLSPCVFLRISEVYDWLPNYYNAKDELPASMPEELVKEIRSHADNQVWISCEAESDIDKESIEAFNYYPGRGFPSYYFPTTRENTEFMSPIIAVEIVNPKPGYIIGIECRIWSKNLPSSKANFTQPGTIRFGIMRDELIL